MKERSEIDQQSYNTLKALLASKAHMNSINSIIKKEHAMYANELLKNKDQQGFVINAYKALTGTPIVNKFIQDNMAPIHGQLLHSRVANVKNKIEQQQPIIKNSLDWEEQLKYDSSDKQLSFLDGINNMKGNTNISEGIFKMKQKLKNVLNTITTGYTILFKVSGNYKLINEGNASHDFSFIFQIPSKLLIHNVTQDKNAKAIYQVSIIMRELYQAFKEYVDKHNIPNAVFRTTDIDIKYIKNFITKYEPLYELIQTYKQSINNDCVEQVFLKNCMPSIHSKIKSITSNYTKGMNIQDIEYLCKKIEHNFNIYRGNTLIKEFAHFKNKKTINLYNNSFNHVDAFKFEFIQDSKIKSFEFMENLNICLTDPQLKIIKYNEQRKDKYIKYVKYPNQEMIKYVELDYIKDSIISSFFNKFAPNDYVYKNKNESFFNWLKDSIIYPCTVKLQEYDNLIGYDKNKCYGVYLRGYHAYPASLDGLYENIYNYPADQFLKYEGIAECDITLKEDAPEQFKKIFNMFGFGDIKKFQHNLLRKLNAYCDIKILYSTISRQTHYLKLDDDAINVYKLYQVIMGLCQVKQETKKTTYHGSLLNINMLAQEEDLIIEEPKLLNNYLQALEQIENEKNEYIANVFEQFNIDFVEQSNITTEYDAFMCKFNDFAKDTQTCVFAHSITPKEDIKALYHIAGYNTAYVICDMIDQLLKIPFDDIVALNVDCIYTNKNHDDKFDIGLNIGQWKHKYDFYEASISMNNIFLGQITNEIEIIDYTGLKPMTKDKLNYTDNNLIIGDAGAGKTSRMARAFKMDETLYNTLFVFPTNDLIDEFKRKYKINATTLANLILTNKEGDNVMIKTDKKENVHIDEKFLRYTNYIIDECTMIDINKFNVLLKLAKKYKLNLFFLGDLDEKRLYQLLPSNGEPAVEYGTYKKHKFNILKLTTNYRQKNKDFIEKLNKIRNGDLCNADIIELFKNRKSDYEEAIKKYNVNYENIILASTNYDVSLHNIECYKRFDTVMTKQSITNKKKGLIKNKRLITEKTAITDKNIKSKVATEINANFGYALTASLSQGHTYNETVIINTNKLSFTKNLLYVMISRATEENNIFMI